MPTQIIEKPDGQEKAPATPTLATKLRLAALLLLMPVILFGCAGRLDLPFFWAYLAIYLPFIVLLMRAIPQDLWKERVSPGEGGVSRSFRALVIPLIIAMWVIPGLDVGRFRWSADMPDSLQIAALVLLVPALLVTAWALNANRFFSPVVRIQSERGHHLVDTGPYAYVRHPGYVANALASTMTVIALGSWWALVPVVIYSAMFAWRTIIEERFLQDNLPGYREYMMRVRWRWFPGIW